MESALFLIINSIIDFVFLMDIFVNFRTSYINPRTGDEVFEPKKIAKNYVKGRFWIDSLATVPFDLLVSPFLKDSATTL
jgi:hypothetical protein